MKHKFIICGIIGWCMEIVWTGAHSIRSGEWKLVGNSSLWMFPIYGMASLISPISKKLKKHSLIMRGGLYTAGFFATEYTTGTLLKKYKVCPWDYSKSPLNYKGLIRFDYAPLWFFASLLFEKILSDNS